MARPDRTRRHRPQRLARSVYLIGFMGAGKSTVSRRLSRMCGLASIDMDSYIERAAGKPISKIFEDEGEEGFRRAETEALRCIAQMGEPMLVSCGGGVVTRDENRAIMADTGMVVHLKVSADQAAARISDTSTRPLFQDLEAARARLEERLPAYEAAADLTIETGGRSVGAIAHDMRRALQRAGVLLDEDETD